jgi:DNA-directed RNA polymerase subunit RPC12/RpoP
MFLETKKITLEYSRPSKLGHSHSYTRTKTVAIFKCDNCSSVFDRDLGNMDRKRLSNDYYHVCSKCDPKRFAQNKGAERRRLWNLPVDSDLNIGKI